MTKQEYLECLETEVYYGIPKHNFFKRLFIRHIDPSRRMCLLIRKMQYHYSLNSRLHRFFASLLQKKIWKESGCCIAATAVIGKGLHLPHPTGIVIGAKSVIGEHCSIYQQVTIGGGKTGDVKKGNQPILGNNVTVFAGAKVLGRISISDNCIIGAQSVVLKDAPENSVMVGIPAKQVNVRN